MNIKNPSSSGFTLAEVVVAMGICSFALLVIMTLAQSAYNSFEETSTSIETAESLSRAAHSLTQALTYATNIQQAPGAVGLNIPRSAKGEIKMVNFTTGITGGFQILANFVRDAGTDASNLTDGPRTQLRGTSIFYYTPTPTTSGVLFINLGSTNPNTSIMTPSYSDLYFDRLTELVIDSPQVTAGVLTGVRIRLTARSFLKADKSLWRWCPQASISSDPNCASSTFKDISRVVYISFVNQVISPKSLWSNSTAPAPPTRLFDILYFFPARIIYE